MNKLCWVGAIVAGTSLLACLGAPPASAAGNDVDDEIAYALEHARGGMQTAWNQITWPDGTTLTIEEPIGRAAAASCTTGKFCAYSGLNASGSHLDFTTCPSTNSVSALPQVRSISNARNSATVTGRNGGTLVVTVPTGATKNVTKTIDKVVCA